ncbi:uncharacterized protein IWZ02DRAFT_292636 [Phyllosticta citriasiana]|uniref:uncharacterized protein n=1 Tax=Phyllosticta citriasiana TaxID=595635 RepID=UPI0030FDE1A0
MSFSSFQISKTHFHTTDALSVYRFNVWYSQIAFPCPQTACPSTSSLLCCFSSPAATFLSVQYTSTSPPSPPPPPPPSASLLPMYDTSPSIAHGEFRRGSVNQSVSPAQPRPVCCRVHYLRPSLPSVPLHHHQSVYPSASQPASQSDKKSIPEPQSCPACIPCMPCHTLPRSAAHPANALPPSVRCRYSYPHPCSCLHLSGQARCQLKKARGQTGMLTCMSYHIASSRRALSVRLCDRSARRGLAMHACLRTAVVCCRT